jgi:thiol-disulfide isomerase/thioredoxin
MKYLFLAFVSLTFIAACNNTIAENNAEKVVETPAIQSTEPTVSNLPSFSIINNKGEVADFTQFKGKRVFVNLWATWCPPCRVEIPSIQKLYAKTDKNKAVFVMLSLDNNFETAKQFAAKTKLDIPIYYPAGNLPALFNVESIPVTFIFDEKGELIHRQEGAADYNTNQFIEMLNK